MTHLYKALTVSGVYNCSGSVSDERISRPGALLYTTVEFVNTGHEHHHRYVSNELGYDLTMAMTLLEIGNFNSVVILWAHRHICGPS